MRAAHPRRTIPPFTSLAMPQLHEPTSGLWRYVGISPHRPTSMRTSSVAWCPIARVQGRCRRRFRSPTRSRRAVRDGGRPARRRRRWRRAGVRLLPRSRYWIPSRARPSSRADPRLLLGQLAIVIGSERRRRPVAHGCRFVNEKLRATLRRAAVGVIQSAKNRGDPERPASPAEPNISHLYAREIGRCRFVEAAPGSIRKRRGGTNARRRPHSHLLRRF